MLRVGGGHRLRMELFKRGIRQGYLLVDEVEDTLPPGLLTEAEKWLLYFSFYAAHIELRDNTGRALRLDEAPLGTNDVDRVNGVPLV